MLEALDKYCMALFGWARRAMENEMAMNALLNIKRENSYLTETEMRLLEDSGICMFIIVLLVVVEAFLLVTISYFAVYMLMKLIRSIAVDLYLLVTRKKRRERYAAACRIRKRRKAVLLQYVRETEERTKGKPDVLKIPEFMMDRRRENHAY